MARIYMIVCKTVWNIYIFENVQWRKSNKCDQYDFISIQADTLRRHLKTHSGEKSNKCDQ